MLGKFMDSCIQGCTVTQWPMLANVSLPDFQRPLSSAMLDQPLIQPRSIRQFHRQSQFPKEASGFG